MNEKQIGWTLFIGKVVGYILILLFASGLTPERVGETPLWIGLGLAGALDAVKPATKMIGKAKAGKSDESA